MMTVVLVNRLGEVWIHSAFVQLVHLLKEQPYQVVFERFSLWKFNIADTLHRPPSCRCCLPTQAACWRAVIRLERSGWQWADECVCVCVCLSLLVSESRTRLMSRLAGCNPEPWVVRPILLIEGVWDNFHYSCSLPLFFIIFFSFFQCIWWLLRHCFVFIIFCKQHTLGKDHLIPK